MRFVAFITLVALLVPDGAAAQADASSAAADLLADLPEFDVVVDSLDDAARRLGLNATRIQTGVESRLFELGLPFRSGAIPYLFVGVGGPVGADSYVLHVSVELRRTVPGAIGPYFSHFFPVWRMDTLATVGTESTVADVLAVVAGLVDTFAIAYETVNETASSLP